jgi:hypothetical protein
MTLVIKEMIEKALPSTLDFRFESKSSPLSEENIETFRSVFLALKMASMCIIFT